jgi:hypothetical protein
MLWLSKQEQARMADISNSDDMIDVRDVIARVEELREQRDDINPEDGLKYELDTDERAELATLESLLDDLKGYGGDEQWNGDWYPVSLIRDSYFETAMDELLEDIGDMPKNIPPYLTITVNYDALQMDYSSVEFDNVTYWYR